MSVVPSVARSAAAASVARYPADRATDELLVQGAASGDRDAIAAVWDRYSDLVRRVLAGALGPDGALDDLVQEVFLAFVRGASKIDEGARLRSYLVSVAVRLAAGEIRRRRVRRWVGLSSTGELPELPARPHDVEAQQALVALQRIVDKLSTRRRMAFVLRHVEGLEMLETAAALRISESTLRRELTRAREQVLLAASREPALCEYLEKMRDGQ